MIKKLIGGVLVIGVIGVVLGGDDTSTNSNPNAPETTQASRCEKVESTFLTELASNDGFDLINGYAVKSNDLSNAYYVSAEFINSGALGIDGEVASWLVGGDLSSPSYIEGVGGFGEEYSSWASGITDKQGSPYDDGYSESRDCVK